MAHMPTMAPMIVRLLVIGVMVGGAVSDELSRWTEGQMARGAEVQMKVRTRCPVCVGRQKAKRD